MGWLAWVESMLPVAVLLRLGLAIRPRRAARPSLVHKPDYAKIAQLERELDIGQPVKSLVLPPEIKWTVEQKQAEWKGGPFLPHAQPGRVEQSPVGISYHPLVQGRPPGWAYCPVCTRVHEGRCAG